MVMSFMVKEARDQLEITGMVYTLRPQIRRSGEDWYNHRRGDRKKGDIFIEFQMEITNDNQLQWALPFSGFNTVEEWRKKAKKSRYLYKVNLL